MRKTGLLKSATAFLLALFLLLPQTVIVEAATTEHNSDSGYDLILDDGADFLTDEDEDSLVEIMAKITDYCNVALVTTMSHRFYSTEDFAADYFNSTFGAHANGTIFVIDRDLNEIYIYSDGEAHKTITNSRAYSITDNTYTYATESHGRDYYTCSYTDSRLNGRTSDCTANEVYLQCSARNYSGTPDQLFHCDVLFKTEKSKYQKYYFRHLCQCQYHQPTGFFFSSDEDIQPTKLQQWRWQQRWWWRRSQRRRWWPLYLMPA